MINIRGTINLEKSSVIFYTLHDTGHDLRTIHCTEGKYVMLPGVIIIIIFKPRQRQNTYTRHSQRRRVGLYVHLYICFSGQLYFAVCCIFSPLSHSLLRHTYLHLSSIILFLFHVLFVATSHPFGHYFLLFLLLLLLRLFVVFIFLLSLILNQH